MRKMICSILLGMWSLVIYAQTEVLVNVDIGDSIPAINLTDIADRPKAEVNLRELSKEKLVILDFWATWCGSCLVAMPKLDSIAMEYVGDVEIITVTTQPKELVLGFLEKRKQRGLYVQRMPKVFDDKELAVLFPHRVIPHYVWLKDEKVIGFTEEVTREAIEQVLSEGKMKLRKKLDTKRISWDMNKKSLLQHLQNMDNIDMAAWSRYSLITTGYLEKVGPRIGYTQMYMDSLNIARFTGVHMVLGRLYRIAYGRARWYINNAAVEIRSESNFFANEGLKGMEVVDWLKDYGVSYEAIVSKESDIFMKMVSDLKEAFPQFRAYVEKTRDTCLVLEEFNNNPRKLWKVSKNNDARYVTNLDCISIENGNIQGLMTSLESTVFLKSKIPLVNEVGYLGDISLSICGSLGSLTGLNEALAPYGLRISKKLAWFDKLIIEDNRGNK